MASGTSEGSAANGFDGNIVFDGDFHEGESICGVDGFGDVVFIDEGDGSHGGIYLS